MSYRNLRRRQCECRALAERQLDEASGRPFHNSAELLSIGDALERPDLAPLVRVTLDTAYVASKTNELLDVCACVSCGESWDTLPAGPALALVVMMPEARVGDVNFVCGRCARRPDLHEQVTRFLRQLHGDDATMRVAHAPGRA
jgi:hypothetical protein